MSIEIKMPFLAGWMAGRRAAAWLAETGPSLTWYVSFPMFGPCRRHLANLTPVSFSNGGERSHRAIALSVFNREIVSDLI